MVQLFYYENRGKSCKSIWKHMGDELKVRQTNLDMFHRVEYEFFRTVCEYSLLHSCYFVYPANMLQDNHIQYSIIQAYI